MTKKRVLSGIRATGRLHLGNYLGAVKGMLALQDLPAGRQGIREFETLYMIADLHTMTTPYDRKTLRATAREVVIDYLASGLDPKKSAVFIQSDLADLHAQLAFYFSTLTTVARMQHLPTYKDKIRQFPKNVTMALLNYPILMAADILIYKASKVPVGVDQEPHLEVARGMARKMNAEYGTDFPEPTRFDVKDEYRFIPSLTGEGKMSKSVEGSYIGMTDDLEAIRNKLASVPTDKGTGKIEKEKYKGRLPTYEEITKYISERNEQSLGVGALMEFVEIFQGIDRRRDYERQYLGEGIRYKDLKEELAEAIYREIKPVQKKRRELEADVKHVDRVIREGAERARVIAHQTVAEVREKMGLL